MVLKVLSAQDKKIFSRYLALSRHELSVYAFQNIYIWKGLFDIRWAIIRGSLCVFFRDQAGTFLYLPPLAAQVSPEAIEAAFKIMSGGNQPAEVSRIENVEEKDLGYYRRLGYACAPKFGDYLCRRQDLVQLRGNAFKSKRASLNYFLKHYRFEYLPFLKKDKNSCLDLYKLWACRRRLDFKDSVYQGMLGDSLSALKILLDNYRDLGCAGRIVKVGGQLKGFSFGFRLNEDTFSILYEVTDLSIKGLAQFIFREFCREMKSYRYINIMDDSGLDNLKKVKLSYRPQRLVPAYIVKQKARREKCPI